MDGITDAFSSITLKTNSMMGGALLATPIMLGMMPVPMPPVLYYGIGGVFSHVLNKTVDNSGVHNPMNDLTPAALIPAAVNGMAGGVAFRMLMSRG
tara:strand:+ start:270 stop:557 length:288 start_codon:yes stop_codon:yes gene_type:complete